MKSLKIAMVAACPFPAAFASSGLIRELSVALSHRGHDVHIVTYHLGLEGFNTEGLHIHRIPHVPFYRKISSGISPGKPFLDLLLARLLIRIIRTYQIDLIHAHNYEALAAALIGRHMTGIPIVYHAHNTMWHELPSYFQSRIARAGARLSGRAMDLTLPHRADHVISLSLEQSKYLIACGVPEDRITRIEPAIDGSAFQNGDGNRIRLKLGLIDHPIIIYTGGLQRYQNCHVLIDLLTRVLPTLPSTHLIILARSSRSEIENYARTQGVLSHVHFVHTSSLSEERDFLAAADIAILPRLHCIGFPIKLLNYLAASLPVICYQSITESLLDNPEIHAAPSGCIDALSSLAVEQLDLHTRTKKTSNPSAVIRERFAWSDKIDAIESIYQRILSPDHR